MLAETSVNWSMSSDLNWQRHSNNDEIDLVSTYMSIVGISSSVEEYKMSVKRQELFLEELSEEHVS